jgi:hypothetical protein
MAELVKIKVVEIPNEVLEVLERAMDGYVENVGYKACKADISIFEQFKNRIQVIEFDPDTHYPIVSLASKEVVEDNQNNVEYLDMGSSPEAVND